LARSFYFRFIKNALRFRSARCSAKRALLAEQEVGSPEYLQLSREMNSFVQKKNHIQYKYDSDIGGERWLLSHLRQSTRRNVQSLVQSGEAAKHLKWIDDESAVLKKLQVSQHTNHNNTTHLKLTHLVARSF